MADCCCSQLVLGGWWRAAAAAAALLCGMDVFAHVPALPLPEPQLAPWLPRPLPQACYVWYNEMYKCYSQKGQDDEQCKKIKKDVR